MVSDMGASMDDGNTGPVESGSLPPALPARRLVWLLPLAIPFWLTVWYANARTFTGGSHHSCACARALRPPVAPHFHRWEWEYGPGDGWRYRPGDYPSRIKPLGLANPSYRWMLLDQRRSALDERVPDLR